MTGMPERCLSLPPRLRPLLREAHRYFTSYTVEAPPREAVENTVSLVGSPTRLWLVGDVVCSNFLNHGYKPWACIVDLRSERHALPPGLRRLFLTSFGLVIEVENPPGMLCNEALEAVKRLAVQGPGLLMVKGEEDLLGLAVLLEAPIGSYLVYGIPPRRGIAIIPVNHENRAKARSLVELFEEANR